MRVLLDRLGPVEIVPDASKYYTFVYNAKTPGIWYDKNPFIVCTSVHPWGFVGNSFHWNDFRRYTWAEVMTNLYEIYEDEVRDMLMYPTANFKRT